MKSIKSFIQSICALFVKLFSVVICCSLLVCCVSENAKPILPLQNRAIISESAIDVNSASVPELERLPHVGEKIARRIVEHRERFGKFRRVENLLLIDGISDERFREIRNFVKVE